METLALVQAIEVLMIWFVVAQVFRLVLDILALWRQSDREKDIEILLLRQQLRILERKQAQPPPDFALGEAESGGADRTAQSRNRRWTRTAA